jgi:hypothetical protein
MAYAYPGDGALDYFPCRYGTSRIVFRGPRRELSVPYVAVLGGTETYGKFVPRPYPDLLEEAVDAPVVNLGCMNAGPDVYLGDPAVIGVAAQARMVVIQLAGVHNLTNRYYAVHPRRNDRFLGASPLLRALFREVDFTEFHFTRHMVQVLHATSPDRFARLAEELRAQWVDRMRALLAQMPDRRVLLWLHPPASQPPDPLALTPAMVAALTPLASAVVQIAPGLAAGDLSGMAFAPLEAPAAAALPGPEAHRRVATALAAEVRRIL